MSFIHDDFLLHSEQARRLYHEYCAEEPIFDFHSHLPPRDVAINRRFSNLFELWLEEDHYKWRAMRSNAFKENLITGDGDPYEKFIAYCETVPQALRNPIYHWSHIELKRYFDTDLLINKENAPKIWEIANAKLSEPEFCAHKLLEKAQVKVVGTTDDPADSMEHHIAIKKLGIDTKIIPTFRPDKAFKIHEVEVFNPWIDALSAAADTDIHSYPSFMEALKKRHDFFHEVGGRLSDHGMERCFHGEIDENECSRIFVKARSGKTVTPEEREMFAFNMMRTVGEWNFEKGWTMQLHLGPMRNNSTRLFKQVGPDIGTDSMGDEQQAIKLSRFLDSLDIDGVLPKTILFNLNPANNYLFASMIGNFQDESVPSKVQFGSGWWFQDQKEGMINQINTLSNLGLIGRFVGMLTDSRSLLSYSRHEYFRRILCNLFGEDMVKGEVPDDIELIGDLVKRISYQNAEEYFGV